MFSKIPKKQGLYDPTFEHDACGMGFVTNIKGNKSHDIIKQALEILVNLAHRGATGSEINTGDGAGILIQIPHSFFKKEASKYSIELPEEGSYGVGMCFLSQDKTVRKKCESMIEKIIKGEEQVLLGWRTVPVNDQEIGESAHSCMPYFRQVFIGKSQKIKKDLDFARRLYLIRKRIEKAVRNSRLKNEIYISSLSHRTIVYKGMLTPTQVEGFFPDLSDSHMETALALVHSRFSTNTFPSWERAQPNRYMIHNGEINTIRGNANWMRARQAMIETDVFSSDIKNIFPIIDNDGSDSAMFDNTLELLILSGRSLPHAIMMMIPEPWDNQKKMEKSKRAFYKYHSCLMEPWDGPAAMAFSDGVYVGAVLDRNGLRPSRYYLSKDDLLILASEVGVLKIDESKIISKQRLEPGRMLLVDTKKGKIINDRELKQELAEEYPYEKWIEQYFVELEDLPDLEKDVESERNNIIQLHKVFSYTYEELWKVLLPMAVKGIDPLGSMGNDVSLAILSEKPQLLYNYFKQLFAQVTNPPIDSIREEIVTATRTLLGSEGNLLAPLPESCKKISLENPIIDNKSLHKLKNMDLQGFQSAVVPILFRIDDGEKALEKALDNLFEKVNSLIDSGINLIILSDKDVDQEKAAIPALLAVSGLHHHLIRSGRRTSVSIILESAEPREVHHFCLLLGYGVDAVNPYLAYSSINKLIEDGLLTIDLKEAVNNYNKAVVKGIVKVMARMGISTIQSYRGAQIFEAVGINNSVINKYFTGTASRIGGIGMEEITLETLNRHKEGFSKLDKNKGILDSGSSFSWRKNGEKHLYNPESIYLLQQSCKNGNYSLFKEYSSLVNSSDHQITLRSLLKLKYQQESIPIDEVESVNSLCKRFKTGAMSFGSISKEAHETLAIAMNRIGGKNNTGEGGEDPERFRFEANGDSRCSAIKQVASGRFGVTSSYLINAKEIQIKIAQGAKPGEGGQLPGKKVYPWIAEARGTTPGVGLISPPPYHDIYSIEDLSQLIYDLKNANPEALINVKLVSEVGVGTIAAGVAKAGADLIVISGYDGGTGASPRTSIQHAGLPWELELAETHQTLVLNNLRNRVKIETDGKLMTGRDLVIAALLGAEEFAFATAPLIVIGCVMMRVCNLNTCPVGIATQDPELRKRFTGKPEYLINFMRFIAREMREEMAKLGFRTIDEMLGRVDKLEEDRSSLNWKNKNLDYKNILFKPEKKSEIGIHYYSRQNHVLEDSKDFKDIIPEVNSAIKNGKKVELNLNIKNIDRAVGTLLGSEVSKKYGLLGLEEDTIKLNFKGTAGQSFAAFLPRGITMCLEGDANDYIGKGLSGGKIIVKVPEEAEFSPEKNISIGNVAFFGGTSGEAYIEGIAGERFCVRNSGVHAVVEGVGDHACEYMTGGSVIVLGQTGFNFAAGMTGGVAYVLDAEGLFSRRCNQEMVDLSLLQDIEDIKHVKNMIKNHWQYTGSKHAQKILDKWQEFEVKFICVMPRDYRRMIEAIAKYENKGMSKKKALMEAFKENNRAQVRVSRNSREVK